MAQVTNLINKTTNEVVHPNIEAANIPADAISTAKVADGAITAAKIASNAISSGKIASNAVTSGKIASDAVTTAKIADENVTTAKVADAAITTAKIINGAITSTKIGAREVYKANMHLSIDTLYHYCQLEDNMSFADLLMALDNNFFSELRSGQATLLKSYIADSGNGVYKEVALAIDPSNEEVDVTEFFDAVNHHAFVNDTDASNFLIHWAPYINLVILW